MGMTKKIKAMLLEQEMSIKQLADKLGTSSQNLNKKLKKDNFRISDLCDIARACGAEFEGNFVFSDSHKKV